MQFFKELNYAPEAGQTKQQDSKEDLQWPRSKLQNHAVSEHHMFQAAKPAQPIDYPDLEYCKGQKAWLPKCNCNSFAKPASSNRAWMSPYRTNPSFFFK
jgi:hypothetical protein